MGRLRMRVLPWALSLAVLTSNLLATAQSPPTKSVTCRIGSPEGAQRYRPGQWGLVEVSAINRTDETVTAAAVLRFVDDPTLQYGRRVVVPPNATLRTTCPILIPASTPAQARHVSCLTDQVLPPRSDEAKQLSPQEALLASQPIILDQEIPAVGLVADMQWRSVHESDLPYHTGFSDASVAPDDPIYEMVLAAKRAQNLTRRMSVFEEDDLPADPAGLAVVDTLILSTDRMASDPQGITLVRDWVLSGGHLWILLDEVQPDTVAAILGDAFATTIVDRVPLTRLRIQNARFDIAEQPFEDLDLEEPVEFVRVIPEGVTVTATVDGWPASFWQPLGTGRVFFTTLSTAAWMRPTVPGDPKPAIPEEDTAYFPRESLSDMAEECVVPRPKEELSPAMLQPILAQQIGYRILSQSTVLAILGGLCLLLATAGCWLAQIGRLERLLWIAPLAAATVSLVFLVAAVATKRAVPPTVATLARVVLEPGVSTGHASGLAAMYNQDASRELLGATRGGIFYPDMTAMAGRHRRVMWTDEGAWNWEQLELPAGVRTAPFSAPLPLDKAVDCRAHFGPQGLEGIAASLPLGGLEDALIVLPHQNAMAAQMHPDGTFTSGVRDVLAPSEFLAQSWMDDQQRRRKTIYEQLFATQPEIDAPAVPILYGWADAADMGFVFPQSNQRGATLLSVRVRLERSPAGTQVAVAAPFIPYRAVADRDGRPPVAFSNIMRTWVDSKLALTEYLEFSLPREVLPLQVTRAQLSLRARAPSRLLEILAFAQGEPVVVLSLSHPIGSYSCVLDRPELLQLNAAGRLLIAVRVGQDQAATPEEQMNLEPWTINSLQLEVTGTVQGE